MATQALIHVRLEIRSGDDEQLQRFTGRLAAQCRDLPGVASVERGTKVERVAGGKSALEVIDWGALLISLSTVGLDHLLGYLVERLRQTAASQADGQADGEADGQADGQADPPADGPPGYPLIIGDERYTLDRPLTPEELPALRARLLAAGRAAQGE